MSTETETTPHDTGLRPLVKVPWRAVVIYVLLACGLAWIVAMPMWLGGDGLRNPLAGLLLPLMMFTPLVATLLVLLFVQKPRPRPVAEFLGMWPLRPVWRTIGMTLAGIFGSALLVISGVFLAAGLGIVQLDLVNFSGFAAVLAAAAPGVELPVPVETVILLQLLLIPFAALINGVLAFGEEIGWRGWLLPSLLPLGTWPALLLSGAIWGLWHSPLILLGYNFAQPNLFGVAMMIAGCTVYGVLIGWLRLRTGSIWPSVFAHGAFNAAGGFLLLVVLADTTPDPVASGPLGWVAWIMMAAVIVILLGFGQFRRQPSLVRRTVPTVS
ncbi:CPBP family intramembrane glutamic endopeptidase [Cryobacterium roopkundense]|uniref:Membrane protease YdiL (CAAX protease family) n=1 Tax=Cryobacterium roopkundense TaxID=1001240 RepID=A0A7W9E4V4_9MICO|nr:CPBP family intramembrane glutamic endopeptidase [Cryobacterium roopkundense]MBB5642623.1 membrane protease YdiL (CAAX protease family) [Cryobacterium roopkundense]